MTRTAIVALLFLAQVMMGAHSEIQGQEWVNQFGDGSYKVTDMALDEKKNMLYLSTNTASTGRIDKFNSNGTLLWTYTPPAADNVSSIWDVAVGSHVYFVSFNAAYDLSLTKLDKNGRKLWSVSVGPKMPTTDPFVLEVHHPTVVTYWPSHHVFVLAASDGSRPIDDQAPIGYYDMALFKFSKDGNKVWTKVYGSIVLDMAISMAVDPLRKIVYITGLISGNIGDQINHNVYDGGLLAIDPDSGDIKWQRLFGGPGPDYPTSLTVDRLSGDVYVIGITRDQFGAALYGLVEPFVLKYDTLGTLQWTRFITNGSCSAVLCDFNAVTNQLIVLGSPAHKMIDGQTPFPSGGGNDADGDVFMMTFDQSGTKLRTVFANVFTNRVTVNRQTGDVYLGGYTHLHIYGDDAIVYKNPVLILDELPEEEVPDEEQPEEGDEEQPGDEGRSSLTLNLRGASAV